MGNILIKGTFHVVGQSPDADSVKFRAANPALWSKIETDNRAVFERNLAADNGVIQLRLQGIDALETHYSPPPLRAPDDVKDKRLANFTEPVTGGYKQLAYMGLYSTGELLNMLGVTGVKWRTFGKSTYISEANVSSGPVTGVIKTKLQDAIPGYIITNDVEQNGRPLAFVFAGDANVEDGATISVDQLAEMVALSVNYRLLQRGMVYPLFFMGLPGKIRRKLGDAAQAAYDAARSLPNGLITPADKVTSIWQIDQSLQGMEIPSLDVLCNDKALFPYLFRKLVRHYYRTQMEYYWDGLRGKVPVNALPTLLNLVGFYRDENPFVFVISDQDFLRLKDVVEVDEHHLRMLKAPHDLVMLS
ncbi:MAG: hypothetical protein KF716_15700 [Anaerolineae bacterium]|nr:hypothetical protein [Anaerolineae bacterium]